MRSSGTLPPMNRWTLAIALVVAVAAAGVTAALRRPPPEGTGVTTTSSSTVAHWGDPAAIAVPPALIAPTRLEYADGLLAVAYEVRPMATGRGAFPSVWTLLTTEAEVTVAVDPFAERVVFDVGPGFATSSITGLRLDEAIVLSPVQLDFRPAPGDFSTHELAPGIRAALHLVQPQSRGAIVRVQITADRPGATADLAADGVGPGWVSASSNFGGGGLWTLSFEGPEVPDPLPLVVRGVAWIPTEIGVVSRLDGVPLG